MCHDCACLCEHVCVCVCVHAPRHFLCVCMCVCVCTCVNMHTLKTPCTGCLTFCVIIWPTHHPSPHMLKLTCYNKSAVFWIQQQIRKATIPCTWFENSVKCFVKHSTAGWWPRDTVTLPSWLSQPDWVSTRQPFQHSHVMGVMRGCKNFHFIDWYEWEGFIRCVCIQPVCDSPSFWANTSMWDIACKFSANVFHTCYDHELKFCFVLCVWQICFWTRYAAQTMWHPVKPWSTVLELSSFWLGTVTY